MVGSLKTGRTGGRSCRDPGEKSMWTGGDDRGAEAEDRMVHQRRGRTVYPNKEEWQRSRWILSSKQRL